MRRALLILLGGQAMASMDASILSVTAPTLRADLHASGAQLQLVVVMYTVAFGTLVVTGARLGDVIGHRRAFMIGLAGFGLSSLAGGLAPTPATLVVARTLQGAAGALMTPQVLSIIQLQFEGEARVRAIGAYSVILAVGVAAGQVLGGLIVGAHLLAASWRPALLLNAPVAALLLLGAWRRVPASAASERRRLDVPGVLLLSAALLAFVFPLTFGRQAGWPAWVWPCFAVCLVALAGFVRVERRVSGHGKDPLFDLDVLTLGGVAAGVAAVLLMMAAYAGFLLSLTIHLQTGLGFSPLHAGLTFAIYAAGFATASLCWTRTGPAVRDRLPVVGPLVTAAALIAVGLVGEAGGWPAVLTTPALFAAGVGHACGFSPLASRLTAAVRRSQAADLSGLVLTSSLVGQVVGIAAFVGVYLAAAPGGSGHALAVTTGVLGAALLVTAACAYWALAPARATTCAAAEAGS
jgi:MFS family permease